MRHLRSLAIAAVVLMISAAVVFAGGGPAWKTTTAELEASPSPSASPSPLPSPSPSPSVAPSVAPSGDPSASPSPSPSDASASPEGLAAPAATEEQNHGKTVSEAAHSGPPEESTEYRNHGAWVSSVARENHGQSKKSDVAAQSKAKGPKSADDDHDEDDD